MNFDLATLRRRASALFAGFTRGQQTMLVIALVGLVLGGFMFTRWSAAPTFAPLYSGLASDDAGEVTQFLTSAGVPYQLQDGGGTVLVPKDRLYQSRLDLSAAGLPSRGAAGYALLDKQGITTSDFRQRVDYQRALEGELANTIGAIDGVDHADVHLVIPKDDLFTGDTSKASASVLITGRSGVTLTSGQVRAVVNLVASSVQGLTPESVTVADSGGKVLQAPGSDASGAGDVRAEQTAAFEERLGRSLETLLSPVVGDGNAVVRVSARLDFDARKTTSERYGNDARAVGERTSKETYTGSTVPTGGALRTTAGQTASSGGDYAKEIADRSFALDKVTEEVQSAPGSVKALSVAVLLDDKSSSIDKREVRRLVTAAAGIDTVRGDTVQVTETAFDRSAAAAAAKASSAAASAGQMRQILGILRVLATFAAVGAVLFFAYRSAKRSSVDRVPLTLPHLGLDQLAGGAYALGTAPGAQQLAGMPAMAGIGAGHAAAGALGSGHVTQLLEKQPDDVAQMLRTWLADGDRP